MDFLNLIWLIPLFPAAGFVINGLVGKRMSKTMVGVIACGLVFISFIFSAGAVLSTASARFGASFAHGEIVRMD